MRPILALVLILSSVVAVCAVELKPADPSTPLLKIYEAKFTSSGSATERQAQVAANCGT
jgi:hypothetical protein